MKCADSESQVDRQGHGLLSNPEFRGFHSSSFKAGKDHFQMRRLSAGLLMFRRGKFGVEVFLVHPGGPLWRKKDLGGWSIPKGEVLPEEDALTAARREFEEETGIKPAGEFVSLGEIKQPSGKGVIAWAFEGDCTPAIRSNTFSMEWPPKSGRAQEFPEVDRAEWFSLNDARDRIHRGQIGFLDELTARFQ
jgi:predicted NUDIX family NTP pyrophosphohydrolase